MTHSGLSRIQGLFLGVVLLPSFQVANLLLGTASAAPAADEILQSMLGTAWEGDFQVLLAGKPFQPIPIRLVNAEHFDAQGRQGYHFAIAGGKNELATLIQATEPRDQPVCAQDPGLSSERYTELHSEGIPGAYKGTVYVSMLKFDPISQSCKAVEIPLPIKSFIVTLGGARKLEITIAPFPAAEIVYRFAEKSPKPADWQAWLKELY